MAGKDYLTVREDDVLNTESYTTRDGKVFTEKAEAKRHAFRINFDEWYEDHMLYGNYAGCRVDAEDVREWIEEYGNVLREYLSHTEEGW